MGILQYGRFLVDQKLNVCNLLDKSAALYGDRPFLYFSPMPNLPGLSQGMSVAAVCRFANRVSNVLVRQAGLSRHERVAVYKDNSADYFLFGMGAMRAGGIHVPINGGMPLDSLIKYLEHTGASVLITDSGRLASIQPHLHRLPRLRCVALVDGAVAAGDMPEAAQIVDLNHSLAVASDVFQAISPAADDDVLLVHTSGTTGFPKAVIHTSGSLVAGVKGQLRFRPYFHDSDFALNAAPASHFVYFLGMLSSMAGCSRQWAAGDMSPRNVLALIEQQRLTIVFCFAHTFIQMQELGLSRFNLDSVRMWLSAADSSHEAHIKEFTRHGALVRLFGKKVVGSMFVDSLGSSEVGFAAVVRFAFSFSKRFQRYIGQSSSAGPRVKVADAEGRPLGDGQVGRIMVKGPTLFKGYWNAHDKLHGVVKNGWWWTGDIGYSKGRTGFYHLDRVTDVIRTRSGEAYSLPIEEHLLKYPGIIEAVVLARNRSDGFQEPVAYVQSLADANLSAPAILDWVNARVDSKDRIAEVFVVSRESIPRGLTGKVLKTVMRTTLASA